MWQNLNRPATDQVRIRFVRFFLSSGTVRLQMTCREYFGFLSTTDTKAAYHETEVDQRHQSFYRSSPGRVGERRFEEQTPSLDKAFPLSPPRPM